MNVLPHCFRRFVFVPCIIAAWLAVPARGQTIEWISPLVTPSLDFASGVSTDALGGAYVSGATIVDVPAMPHYDAWVRKYDEQGTLEWTRTLATPGEDRTTDIVVNPLGGAYVTGVTRGSLGGPLVGGFDGFVASYDTSGHLAWVRQLGTPDADFTTAIAADPVGNAFVVGVTTGNLDGSPSSSQDAFVVKYDPAGNQVWVREISTALVEQGRGVATDFQGNVYVSGVTTGNLEMPATGIYDVFIRKFDTDGNVLWTRQLDTGAPDQAEKITTDALGNVLVVGWTSGSFGQSSAGGRDAFVAKYASDGDLLWTQQIGTSADDLGYGITTDLDSNVYISGSTQGAFSRAVNAGGEDGFVAKLDPLGNWQWTEQFGTSERDGATSISSDPWGRVWFTGNTGAFVGRIVPEPSSYLLCAVASAIMFSLVQRKAGRVRK